MKEKEEWFSQKIKRTFEQIFFGLITVYNMKLILFNGVKCYKVNIKRENYY